MQFSMKQFLTGILNSDSDTSVRKVHRHSSAEAIGGVRPRYVGVTCVTTQPTMQQSNPNASSHWVSSESSSELSVVSSSLLELSELDLSDSGLAKYFLRYGERI